MPKFGVTVYSELATFHEVEAEDPAGAIAGVDYEDPGRTATGNYSAGAPVRWEVAPVVPQLEP